MQFSWLLRNIQNTEARTVGVRHRRLPDTAGAPAGRGQDPSRGPLRDVVIDLRPWEKKTHTHTKYNEICSSCNIKTTKTGVRFTQVLFQPTWEAKGRLVEVSDPLVHPTTGLVGCLSIYWAQAELLLHGVCHLGHVTRVRIPDNSFISLSLKQRICLFNTHTLTDMGA